MMRTLARRTKAWRARSRTSWTGKRPGTRSVPPPQPPSSGRRQQPQQFFAPTARSSTSGFQHLAANPPWQLAHLATPVGPLGRCPRLSAPPGPGQRHGGELPSVPLCPARTSPRSAGLVIDTVVCHLPSGRPGPVGSGAVSSRQDRQTRQIEARHSRD